MLVTRQEDRMDTSGVVHVDNGDPGFREIKLYMHAVAYAVIFLNLIMSRSVRIFRSMKEQEQYHQQLMKQSTVLDRFRRLLLMQQMNRLLHPPADTTRKISIRKWIS